MIVIMIIMNMQKNYTHYIFSHHPVTNLHPVPERRSRNLEIVAFTNFTKLLKKTELPDKFELLAKRGFKLTEKRRPQSCSLARPN